MRFVGITARASACGAGCAYYHMGDSGASTSLARFKERLGAVPVDYADVRLERYPITPVDRTVRTAVKKTIGFRDPAKQAGNDEKLAAI